MRMSRLIVLIFAAFCVLWSCKKDRSFESGTGVVPEQLQWQFTEGSSTFNGPMDTAYIRAIGVASSLSLSGQTTDGTGSISLQLIAAGTIVTGTYQNAQVLFQYLSNGTAVYQNSPDQASDQFTITLNTLDSGHVSGVFSGTVTDAAGNKKTITNGSFTAVLASSTDVPNGTGQLTLWSKSLCDGAGAITVKVGDSTAQITQAMSAEPTCGAAGAATFTLPAGSYTVTAYCGTDSVVLSASVLPNVCSTLQVDVQGDPNADYFPLESQWNYGSKAAYNDDTMSITSRTDTVINGKTYRIFYDEARDMQHYYRKEAGNYYEYITRAFGTDLSTPAEILFLKDGEAKGATWDNPTYTVDLTGSGIPRVVTVLVRETITNRDFSQQFGSIYFNHLIEVTTDMYTVNGDGSVGQPISSFVTNYSKGVGIAEYMDLENGTDWLLRSFSVSY